MYLRLFVTILCVDDGETGLEVDKSVDEINEIVEFLGSKSGRCYNYAVVINYRAPPGGWREAALKELSLVYGGVEGSKLFDAILRDKVSIIAERKRKEAEVALKRLEYEQANKSLYGR